MIRLLAICPLIFLFSGCPQINQPTPGPPTAAFLADVTTTTGRGLTVSFTDMSLPNGSQITAWQWNFGDGETSQEQDPVHRYDTCSTQGLFTVTLRVTNEYGSDIHTEVDLIDLQDCRAN
jgi:PKD repeat protein